MIAKTRDRGIAIPLVDRMTAFAPTAADREGAPERDRAAAGSAARFAADKGLAAAYLGTA